MTPPGGRFTGTRVTQYTFATAETLTFVIPDNILNDNNGGLSIVVSPAITANFPGDYNDDGVVDAADYVVWRKNEGTMNTLPHDPNGGIIDSDQYNTWRANFGMMTRGSG